MPLVLPFSLSPLSLLTSPSLDNAAPLSERVTTFKVRVPTLNTNARCHLIRKYY